MAEQLKVEGGPSVAVVPTSAVKTATLTFSKEDEVNTYEILVEAAAEKDYSLSKYIVRILTGKEKFPGA